MDDKKYKKVIKLFDLFFSGIMAMFWLLYTFGVHVINENILSLIAWVYLGYMISIWLHYEE